MNTTWIQIMRFARALEDGRRAGVGIEPKDAERLFAMLLDFQRRALHERPLSVQGPAIPVPASSAAASEKRPGARASGGAGAPAGSGRPGPGVRSKTSVSRSLSRFLLHAIVLTVAFVVVTSAAGAVCVARWWPLVLPGRAASWLPGARLEGRPLAAGADLRAQVAAAARDLLGRRVRFVVHGRSPPGGDVLAEATLGELGVTVDSEATAARVLRAGRTGDPATRAADAERARRGGIDVPLARSFDARPIFAILAPFKEDLDAAPVAARLDLQRHTILAERDGRALDLDAAAAALVRVATGPADADSVDIDVPFTAIPAAVTRDALARIDVSRVLAAFDTHFSRRGDQEPRARNIEVAAAHIDGLVVHPGQVESFNDVVGARSEENGFHKAFEIYKGEYVEGMGGGTCQVASTVHAAAFFGGLDVVERLPHSRPSVYIPTGLDATVVFPTVDLKFRNPFSFPVVFHTIVTANALHVELRGADKPVAVALRKEVVSTTPFDRKVVEDRVFRQPKRTQKGADGLELRRSRILVDLRGRARVETSLDRYPPTQEIWKVPPEFDEDLLPPLGEDPPSETDGGAPAASPPAQAPDPARI
jgi:vancomycin resistance protein YoaR